MAKCLSFHAPYRCRQSGACCSAGWTIPFTPADVRAVRALPLSIGSIDAAADGGTAVLRNGQCSFLDTQSDRCACEIHRAGGHAALPLTCRMFPRQVLHDGRGTFISLSHFCPTAAELLFADDGPVTVVNAPDALRGDGTLDGLDARDAWPPLLRRGILMDLESYGIWERAAIQVLTHASTTPLAALNALDAVTARIDRWSPADPLTLARTVADAFAAAMPPISDRLQPYDGAVKRWLAARLFGSWIAYQGNALRTIVRYLRVCHDVFVVELARDRDPRNAIRRSDHLIVHESSSQQLARLLDDGA